MIIPTVLCWLTGVAASFSQDYLFDVDIIGVEDGLPHRNAYKVVQDKEGFIWVSTLGGISRYDGYRFKTYDYTVLDIPESRNPQYLSVDAANRLWYYGTETRVINSRQDSIYTVEAVSEGRFTSEDVMYVGNSSVNTNDILVATRPGIIYEYDGNFKEIYRAPEPFSKHVRCQAAPDGSYWIIYDMKAIRIKNGKRLQTIEINSYKAIRSGVTRIVATSPCLILDIFYSPDVPVGRFWKLENNAFVPFTVKGHEPQDITGLLQVHEDYTCYTTKNALFVQDKQGNNSYVFDQFKPLNSVWELHCMSSFLDRQNTLWVTTANGLLKITAKKKPFKHIGPKASIRGIYREGEQLWIGSHDNNVVQNMNGEIQKEEFWSHLYIGAAITSFYKDHRGQLWMGTNLPELIMYDPGKDTYSDYEFAPGLILSLVFQNAITKNYWVGTNNGVFRFDPASEKLTPLSLPIASATLQIHHFYQNTKGIWIVSDRGIFLMDAQQETIIKHYTNADGLPTNNLNHLHEDTAGVFWLGAKDGGLIRWDIGNNTFQQYTTENGLSDNTIYAVYEDDFETLWLPSNYGLMAFDKNTQTTKVYLPQNGIAHEEFNYFAHFQDKDGTLYFGGLDGTIMFHPADLRQETAIATPLYATGIRILAKDATTFEDKTAAYTATKRIRLNPTDRILEVELTLLDYENSSENQYAYKLAGRQEQWIHTNDSKLSIINPPYGKYDLVVKGRGASGKWSENLLSIPLHVQTPFYLQWWFILSAVIAIAATVTLAVRWRIRRLKKDRKRLEEEVRKRTWRIEEDKKTIEKQAEALEALDKAKTRFFANITHEFRTPLTLIIGPMEQLAASVPQALKAKTQAVRNNAKHLLGLINQLLDISKLESGQVDVKASTADVVAFTNDLVQRFKPLAGEKEQSLIFNPTLDIWKTHFDAEKLSKILYNLISNAVKYTPEKGRIELSLSKNKVNDKAHIEIRVKDSGIGIAADALPHIFDRFYQVDDSATRQGEGTGIGLALVKELVELQRGEITVESQPEKGSVFTVRLPVLAPPMHPDATVEVMAPQLPSVADKKSPVPDEKQTVNTFGENKLELLIIEDNAEMRNYIRSCMDPSVYKISEAANGEDGIAKAQEMVPDLIISDIMMPEKDGFEVTKAIRNHTATSHIPVILLTAKASDDSRLEGINRGADAYLTKPFSPQELSLRVEKLIEIRKILRARYQNNSLTEAEAMFRKEDHFVIELKNYVLNHISDPDLSVEAISMHFDLSRMQLYRKLKALMNNTIGNYIRSVRLEMATQLIKEQELNMTEIAYTTGFSSIGSFSRAFKKMYGKAPSELQ